VMPSLLYTEVEEDLRGTVRQVLRDRADPADILHRLDRDEPTDRALWMLLANDLGLAGLPVGEDAGGAGATWREAAVVLEELGRAVAEVPYFTSAVLATAVLDAARRSTAAQRGDIGAATTALAEVAKGDRTAALVVPFAASPTTVSVTYRDGRLLGDVPLVAGTLEADLLLVPTEAGLFALDADRAERRPALSLDQTRRLADLRIDAPAGPRLAGTDVLEPAGDIASALLASEQLGLAERCLELTAEYLQVRRQFGRTLSSYQALKHRLADLWTAITQARAVARYAAACASTEDADLPVAAALARVVCSRVAVTAAEECVQLHGGIGFTWEHPAHLYLKRARADALALGGAARHRGWLGALVGLDRPATTLSTRSER